MPAQDLNKSFFSTIGLNKKVVFWLIVSFVAVRMIYLFFFADVIPLIEKLIISAATPIFLLLYFLIIAWLNKILEKPFPYKKYKVGRVIIQTAISCVFLVPIPLIGLWMSKNYGSFEILNISYAIGIMANIIFIAAINLAFYGGYFFDSWRQAFVESQALSREKAEIQKNSAQLQYHNLINQLNPHFFFNSIASLDSLIKEDPVLASAFLQQLSKVYRYILQNRQKELVSLETEITFAHQYFALLKTRFGAAFVVETNLEEDAMEKQIVPVTLQVLTENAIKHNKMSTNEPLTLRIFTQDGYLNVLNNKQLKPQVEHTNKSGLQSMKDMYALIEDRQMEIENHWDSFNVKIPLIPAFKIMAK
ncbi:MAG: sensor histidine kinase [Cyclobacteriaceae bacterium]